MYTVMNIYTVIKVSRLEVSFKFRWYTEDRHFCYHIRIDSMLLSPVQFLHWYLNSEDVISLCLTAAMTRKTNVESFYALDVWRSIIAFPDRITSPCMPVDKNCSKVNIGGRTQSTCYWSAFYKCCVMIIKAFKIQYCDHAFFLSLTKLPDILSTFWHMLISTYVIQMVKYWNTLTSKYKTISGFYTPRSALSCQVNKACSCCGRM